MQYVLDPPPQIVRVAAPFAVIICLALLNLSFWILTRCKTRKAPKVKPTHGPVPFYRLHPSAFDTYCILLDMSAIGGCITFFVLFCKNRGDSSVWVSVIAVWLELSSEVYRSKRVADRS